MDRNLIVKRWTIYVYGSLFHQENTLNKLLTPTQYSPNPSIESYFAKYSPFCRFGARMTKIFDDF